jgi:hypothetical protein
VPYFLPLFLRTVSLYDFDIPAYKLPLLECVYISLLNGLSHNDPFVVKERFNFSNMSKSAKVKIVQEEAIFS